MLTERSLLQSLRHLLNSQHLDLIISEELLRDRDLKVKEKLRTEILDLSSVIVNKSRKFLNLRGRGTLREIMLISDSPDFRVVIGVDGRECINKTFSELQEVSTYLNSIDAFEDDGKYVFHVSGISFRKSLSFEVYTIQSIRFEKVYAVFDISESD